MRHRIKPFLAIFISLLLITSCTDVRKSGLKKIAKQAEFTDISIYDKEESLADPVTFRIAEMAEFERLAGFASDKETEAFKCGYSGEVNFLKGQENLLQMEFNLDDACQHITYTLADKTYFSALTPVGVTYLKEKAEAAAVQYEARKNLRRMKWLVGKWAYITKNVAFYEDWDFNPDGTLSGKGKSHEQGEEPILETMTLEAVSGDIYYVVKVSDQEPVRFLLTEQTDSLIVFENPDHDMPKRISYQRQPDGVLHAWIEGDPGGGTTRMDFYFVIQTIIEE